MLFCDTHIAFRKSWRQCQALLHCTAFAFQVPYLGHSSPWFVLGSVLTIIQTLAQGSAPLAVFTAHLSHGACFLQHYSGGSQLPYYLLYVTYHYPKYSCLLTYVIMVCFSQQKVSSPKARTLFSCLFLFPSAYNSASDVAGTPSMFVSQMNKRMTAIRRPSTFLSVLLAFCMTLDQPPSLWTNWLSANP